MNIPEKEGRYLFCFDVGEGEYYHTVDEVMIDCEGEPYLKNTYGFSQSIINWWYLPEPHTMCCRRMDE